MILLPFLLACQQETFVPHCDQASTDLAWDEDSPLGFSAADALGTLRDSWSADATTLASSQTPLLAKVAAQGQARFVDQEHAPTPDGAAVASIYVVCDDYLAVGVDLDLSTGDGQLDELLAVDLVVADPEGEEPPPVDGDGMPTEARFAAEVATDALGGEVDLSGFSMDGYYAAYVAFYGKVHADGSTDGTAELVREGEDADSAYVVSDELVAWGDER